MKTGYKRKYTENTVTYIVRTIYNEPQYQRLNYIRLLSKSQVLRKHDLRLIGPIKKQVLYATMNTKMQNNYEQFQTIKTI